MGPSGLVQAVLFYVLLYSIISQRIFSFITLALKHFWKPLSENKKDSWKLNILKSVFDRVKIKNGNLHCLIIHTFFLVIVALYFTIAALCIIK